MKKIEFAFWKRNKSLSIVLFSRNGLIEKFNAYSGVVNFDDFRNFSEVFDGFLFNYLECEIDETDQDYIEARFLLMPLYLKPNPSYI